MYYGFETSTSFILMIASIIITIMAQIYVTSSYNRYKRIKNQKNLSGFEVARKILDNYGLNDIHIVETRGNLSDHYDPKRKVIRLSNDIFNGTTIAAVSVAAHEVGHAIQDKEGYAFLKFRNFIFPLVNLSSKLGYVAIFIGFIFGIIDLAYIGILLLVVILLFQLITLPVEFNASKRAIIELEKNKFLEVKELNGGKTMLTAAALTYVAALVTTLLQVLRLLSMARSRD